MWLFICGQNSKIYYSSGRRKGDKDGAALELIPDSEPFMLIWNDLILTEDFVMPMGGKNYIGISKDFRCRLIDGGLLEEASIEHGGAALLIG